MDFLDLIFPKKCVGCAKSGAYFCQKCLDSVKKVFQVCPVCERPSPFGQTHKKCSTRNSPDGLISFFEYNGAVRNAIHQLKYKFVTDLEKEFWLIISENIKKREEEMLILKKFIDEEKPIVVPIPLHKRKENFRGFNQSGLFGKRIACQFNLQYSDKILTRVKNVSSQTKLTQKERQENVKGIFRVPPNILPSLIPNVLIIDDVWTTGSTLKEATRVLKEGGSNKVWGITIAR